MLPPGHLQLLFKTGTEEVRDKEDYGRFFLYLVEKIQYSPQVCPLATGLIGQQLPDNGQELIFPALQGYYLLNLICEKDGPYLVIVPDGRESQCGTEFQDYFLLLSEII